MLLISKPLSSGFCLTLMSSVRRKLKSPDTSGPRSPVCKLVYTVFSITEVLCSWFKVLLSGRTAVIYSMMVCQILR